MMKPDLNDRERYRIEFRGQITRKYTIEEVIDSLSSLFKTDKAQVERLFDGKQRILKTNIDWQGAMDYHNALIGYGALCDIKVILDDINLNDALVSIEDYQTILPDSPEDSMTSMDRLDDNDSNKEHQLFKSIFENNTDQESHVDSIKAALNSRTRFTFEFKGEYNPEYNGRKIMTRFSELFDSDIQSVEDLFLGRSLFVKHNLNYFTVIQYFEAFTEIGLFCTYHKQDEVETLDAETEIPVYIITCPKCGNQQEGGEECEACGIIFERFLAMQKRLEIEKLEHEQNREHKLNLRKARNGLLFGIVALLSIVIVDEWLQTRGVDIGHLPFLLTCLPFMYASSYMAVARGYSEYYGLIGITNVFGPVVLLLFPNKNKSYRPFQYTLPAIMVITLVFGAIYWNLTYQAKRNRLNMFISDSLTLGQKRHDYPDEVIDDDPRLYESEIELMENNIAHGFELIQSEKYRPDQIKLIANQIYNDLAGLFIWMQYQQYLHIKLNNTIPEHLQEHHVNNLKLRFKEKINRRIQENKLLESNSSFKHAYYQWNGGCYKWNPFDNGCEGENPYVATLTRVLFQFNEYFRIKRTITMYKNKKVRYRVRKPAVPNIKKRIVSYTRVEDDNTVELKIAKQYMGDMSGKSLVMAFFMMPGDQNNKGNPSLKFTQIGGTISNKYLEQYSVFYSWREKADNSL